MIDGGSGNDRISVRGNRNNIRGGTGNDYIEILSGFNNRVDAGGGDDEVIGSQNADIIEGGAGNDILTGRGGNDVFVFGTDSFGYTFEGQAFDYTDTITDFTQGKDKLAIEGISFGQGAKNNDGSYSFDNGTNVLTIAFSDDITLTAADFSSGSYF